MIKVLYIVGSIGWAIAGIHFLKHLIWKSNLTWIDTAMAVVACVCVAGVLIYSGVTK